MTSATGDSSQTQPTLSPTEALWAHVLRKDKANFRPKSQDLPQIPAGPVDRNATSSRILLYDTQARLEQFSSRADAMLKNMQDANHQLKTVGMLFEKDRDTLTNDIIDLVNRSQREIQKALGNPAQELQFSTFQEKMELRIEGLNQRLDALHMFNQTHTQTMESYSQILKSVQDQQNALLSAVLPLLPLVQTLPCLIEQTKTGVQEMNTHINAGLKDMKQDLLSIIGSSSLFQASSSSRKRRLSGSPFGRSPLSLKKIRTVSPHSTPSIATGKDDERYRTVNKDAPTLTIITSPDSTTSPAQTKKPALDRQCSVLVTPKPKHVPALRGIPTSVSFRTHSKNPPSSSSRKTSSPAHQIFPVPPNITSKKIPARAPTAFRPSSTPLSANTETLKTRPPRHLPSPENPIQRFNNKGISPPIFRKLTVKPIPTPIIPSSHYTTSTMTLSGNHKRLSTTALNVPTGLFPNLTPSFIVGNQSRNRRSPPRDGRRFIPLDDDDDDDDDDD